jgi:DNA-binding response OmpR family regulator
VRRTILVVDDDPDLLQALVGALEEEGYATHRSTHAKAALEVLAEHPIDLVLTDVVLPGLDGVSLVHELRKREHHLPVIIMSGMVDGVALSETPFVSKPFDMSHLLKLVERMVRLES